MSLPSKEKGQNFEILYNSLKNEYDQAIIDNDEICKEYESTIELLKNTLDKTQAEKEKLQNKNKEKLVDIQELTKLNDKLKEDIKKIKEEKKLKESKIVFLENDNEHYQNKIRQYEAIIDDLNSQLESTLEENITIQTEFEMYKQTASEELMRKNEELQDCKSDIEKNKNNLVIETSNFKLNLFKSTNDHCIYRTETKKNNDEENKDLVTPIFNCKAVLPGKFQEIYRKSIKNITLSKFEENKDKKDVKKSKKVTFNKEKNNSNSNLNDNLDSQASSNIQPKVNDINDKEKEDNEKIINDDFEQEESSSCFSYEKKIFEDLVICNEKIFSINSVKNLVNDKLMKNKKLKENLTKLLILTQQRKNNLINRRINIVERLDKLRYKIRDIF